MSSWGVKAKSKKKKAAAVNTNGEFTFKTVLGEKVVHVVHAEITKLLAVETPRSERVAARLAELYSQRAFFSEFPLDVSTEICKHITMTSYFRGQAIVNQGERGFDIFVINCGECVVKVTPKNKRLKPFIVMTIEAGGSFGKLGLLGDGLRKASVLVNVHDTEVIKIPQQATQVLKSFWQEQHRKIADFLTTRLPISITRVWKHDVMEHVAHKMHEEVFPRGTVLLAQGKESEVRKLYFVKWGDCQLLKTIGGRPENTAEIDTLSTGGCFGFVSVDPTVRPLYSVVTTTEVTVLVSATSDLLDVVDERVVQALDTHMGLYDVDEAELLAVLRQGIGWRQWKESLVDDVHSTEYFNRHRIDAMGSLRGVSLLPPNIRHPASSISQQQQPQQQPQQGKEHKRSRSSSASKKGNNNKNTINNRKRVTFIETPVVPVKEYQHEPYEEEIKHASSIAAIRQSLSNSLLGRSDFEEMTEEQKQKYMLEVIENLPKQQQRQQQQQEQEELLKTGREYLSFQYPPSFRENANASYLTVAVNPLLPVVEDKNPWRRKAKPTSVKRTAFPLVLAKQLEQKEHAETHQLVSSASVPLLQFSSSSTATNNNNTTKTTTPTKEQQQRNDVLSKAGRIGHVQLPPSPFDMKPRSFQLKIDRSDSLLHSAISKGVSAPKHKPNAFKASPYRASIYHKYPDVQSTMETNKHKTTKFARNHRKMPGLFKRMTSEL